MTGRPGARSPLFVGRRTYRQRRLMDAARLLPFLGAILLVMPLFWGGGPGQGQGTARTGIYLFGVWVGLIGAGFWLARGLAAEAPEPDGDPR